MLRESGAYVPMYHDNTNAERKNLFWEIFLRFLTFLGNFHHFGSVTARAVVANAPPPPAGLAGTAMRLGCTRSAPTAAMPASSTAGGLLATQVQCNIATIFVILCI